MYARLRTRVWLQGYDMLDYVCALRYVCMQYMYVCMYVCHVM